MPAELTSTESASGVTDREGEVAGLSVVRGLAALAFGGLAAVWGVGKVAVAAWGLVSAWADSTGRQDVAVAVG